MKPTPSIASYIAGIYKLFRAHFFVNVFFIALLLLDVFGLFHPEVFDRRLIIYAIFPFFILTYLIKVKTPDHVYIFSLFLASIGEYALHTNTRGHLDKGLICHSFTFLIYAFLLYRSSKLIRLNYIAKFILPMLIFIWLPAGVFSKNMASMDILYESSFYIFSSTLFIFMSIVNFISRKNLNNLLLCIASTIFILGAYFEAYSAFVELSKLCIFWSDLLIYTAHLLICFYFIKAQNNSLPIKN